MEKEKRKRLINVKINNETVELAEQYIEMVGSGHLQGCIMVGPAGMGKTHLVCNTLDNMDVQYEVYGGHITLAEIYEYLFENSDKLIFFDDVSQVVSKPEIMEMLKQALNTTGDRRLHYRSKGVLRGNVPNNFKFTGRIIFAFNLMDKKNPNVKAIMDRAPVIELKYSRGDILNAMYDIAKHPLGGGLLEYEKIIVTKEIETYTDSSMDISLRKQLHAFKIFSASKARFGEGNEQWKPMIHKLFGKKQESWIKKLVRELAGEGKMTRKELARQIAIRKDMSPRNAHRRINEFLELEEIYQNKLKFGDVSIKPFK